MSDTDITSKSENTTMDEKKGEERIEDTDKIDVNKKEDDTIGGVPDATPVKDLKPAFDDVKEESALAPPTPARKSTNPVKLSPIDATIAELVEMFPETDIKYVKMALIASEGRLEPASNALLFLSDPDSGIEIPHPKPLKTYKSSQLEQDEKLARRLAKSYDDNSKPKLPPKTYQAKQTSHKDNVLPFGYADSDDDDLLENLNKTVSEAKVTIGSWIGSVAKKIQEAVEQPPESQKSPGVYEDDPAYKKPTRSRKVNSHHTLPSEVQRGYSVDNNNDDIDERKPRLPPRKSSRSLYSAINSSEHSLTGGKITLNSAIDNDNENEVDDLYTSKLPEKPKISLNDVEPQPSNDAFTVEDSEDE
ncbi:hypothetical protein CANINC_005072 [Pichia inconspicua]|uniref:CUE domain-containing protein n=1 Tax=Pichia inconspicua TaxID=52247 RepID=A0A4T0WUJ6_9ASCO|nr:hypothetical protein CANINC_005072 [[Candida] inconspicua]